MVQVDNGNYMGMVSMRDVVSMKSNCLSGFALISLPLHRRYKTSLLHISSSLTSITHNHCFL